jgi:hypothetical protein
LTTNGEPVALEVIACVVFPALQSQNNNFRFNRKHVIIQVSNKLTLSNLFFSNTAVLRDADFHSIVEKILCYPLAKTNIYPEQFHKTKKNQCCLYATRKNITGVMREDKSQNSE